jgi:transposase InsO family protein
MRQFVGWPHLDMDIQKHVTNCESCNRNHASRSNWQLSSWPECEWFYQRVFIDICYYNNKQFLVLVDGFSNFVDVHQLSNITSKQVIAALSLTFRYFGYPEELVCDNGRQFISTEFCDFLDSQSINLVLTPPYHSQSNGKVERTIRTFKLFLSKNSDQCSLNSFCMSVNFCPSSNGIIPCVEYLKVQPRTLMKRCFLSDKRGVSDVMLLDPNPVKTVVPLENQIAHSGGIIIPDKRVPKPNPLYFNGDYVH